MEILGDEVRSDQICRSWELPGVKEEDVDITITNNFLTLKGEKKEKKGLRKKIIIVSRVLEVKRVGVKL